MKYYASGKLMISGEYTVLNGATALAIPVRYGQKMSVDLHDSRNHRWQSFEPGGLWFEAEFSKDLKQIINTNDLPKAKLIQNLLQHIQNQKPELFKTGLHISTDLEFNRHWGLGSSSTLIVLLSQWAKLNPYELLDKSFGGSGYDIAVALENQAVLYSLKDQSPGAVHFQYRNKFPHWEKVSFNPSFANELFFVYLNRKQNSRNEIKKYKTTEVDNNLIKEISFISKKLPLTKKLPLFEELLNHHEEIMSGVLQRPTIKKEFFSDYNGSIKSLGAWGGDFILATGLQAPEYFRKKGYSQIIPFKQMYLQS